MEPLETTVIVANPREVKMRFLFEGIPLKTDYHALYTRGGAAFNECVKQRMITPEGKTLVNYLQYKLTKPNPVEGGKYQVDFHFFVQPDS